MEIKSLYVHFPYCIKKCNYCDFFSEETETIDFDSYHQFLDISLDKQEELFEINNVIFESLDTLYIGGGTPSYWGQKGIEYLDNVLKGPIELDKDCEFTLEVNPGTKFLDDFKSWKSIGVNRFSVGIQGLNNDFLKYLGRVHSRQDAVEIMKCLAKNKENYSIDLMLGLPFSEENNRNIIRELKEVLKYSPTHISMYLLSVDDSYKYFDYLPSDEYVENEYLQASQFLVENGFEHYEISSWAKKNQQSKHNMKYWEPTSWAALGPSASGNIQFEDKCTRYKWDSEFPKFELEYLDAKDIRLEKLSLGLRTNKGIIPKDIFKGEELILFSSLVQKWKMEGFINNNSRGVALSDRGFLVFNFLMDDIFNKIKSL